jgi:hypothetical protein
MTDMCPSLRDLRQGSHGKLPSTTHGLRWAPSMTQPSVFLTRLSLQHNELSLAFALLHVFGVLQNIHDEDT